MASLVEELVTVLEEEEKIYQTLISYGEKKTDILIRACKTASKFTGP